MSETDGRRRGGRRGGAQAGRRGRTREAREPGPAAPAAEPAASAGSAGEGTAGQEAARPAEPDRASGDGHAAGGAGEGPRPGAPGPHVDRSICLCAGLGPLLTQALRTLSVPDEVKHSLHETEREALRLLRTLIEMRLSSIGPDEAGPREPARGVRLDVS